MSIETAQPDAQSGALPEPRDGTQPVTGGAIGGAVDAVAGDSAGTGPSTAAGPVGDAGASASASPAVAASPDTLDAPGTATAADILTVAREQVLEQGLGLDQAQILAVLELPDERLEELLGLAHEVRRRWCGPEVEVEGIVSVKTGGCPEDCHFCSQSGLFPTPVRAAWLDIPSLVEAAVETAATGASEFCIVAAVRGPDKRLMEQMREGVAAIKAAVDINVAASLGMLTQDQVDDLAEMGVHRYNHNLETARSYFPNVVTTHTWEERWDTLRMVRDAGMEVCCGGIVGMGETLEQRAEFAGQLAELQPHEVPLNFLNPRPGTPFGDREPLEGREALRTIAAFRLALPRTILRYAGGREITLGDLGTEQGLLGGINAVIVGNYLTTLGRPATADLELLQRLEMPVKALGATL
jgi:biotin synthase